MTCPRHTDAGAYLLATLLPAERASFQAHLSSCDDCRRSVGELADLPGLLSRVPEPGPTGRRIVEPPPSILLGLLDEVARRRSNRLLLTACAAVVTVLAFLGVAVLAVGQDPDGPATVTGGPTRTVAMQPVVAGDVLRASLDLTAHPWGTEIRLHCDYYGDQGSPVYVLAGRAGAEDRELARWSAQTGEEVRLSAATDARSFESFEIRTVGGRVLMRGAP